MSLTDVYTLLPIIIIAASILVLMLVIAFYRQHLVALLVTLSGLGLVFVSFPFVYPHLDAQITPLIILDGFAIFYIGLIVAAGMIVAIFGYDYLKRLETHREEFYILLLLAVLGSAVLVASSHFASFLLSLEILSITLYAMIAYTRIHSQRIEAGLKYLILAGATTAFLMFGMALVYAETGSLSFRPDGVLETFARDPSLVMLIGWGMIFVGIAFKLALVPIHIWVPDVYQGAAAPVTAFIATVSKAAIFALMLRYFIGVNFHDDPTLMSMFSVIAVASILIGNLLALTQNSVKRILAYSSIAHMGYLMVAFLAQGALAQPAVAFYFVAYFLTILSAFGVISLLSDPDREIDQIEDYRALFWRRPWQALPLAISLISLAGLPPSAGLIGKIYIAAAGVESSLWLLLITLAVGSVIGVFYYIRVLITLFLRPTEDTSDLLSYPAFSRVGGALLLGLMILVVGLGIFPTPVFRLIEAVVTILG
jgi:NADH-quinone oxidoreductase subunit N